MSATWITVHKYASGSRAPEHVCEALINLDLVAAIHGHSQGGSLLIWHASSPRTEWTVTESPAELMALLAEREAAELRGRVESRP